MITPAFNLDQDLDHLTLNIRVPYTRTSEFDLFIDGDDFKFYAKPYFLRLTLPGRIVQDGREKARFDIDKGVFTLQVPKETPGETFEGLQMLTSLLAPRGLRSAEPLVEDLSAGSSASVEEEEEEEEFDWQVEQEVYTERSEEELAALQKYGFGNQRSGVFDRLQEELGDVIDVKNPEATTAGERRIERLAAEDAAFSSDHYLADLFEDEEIQRLLKFRPWWANVSSEDGLSFTEDEKEQLRKFNNRSYLLDRPARRQVFLSLLDLLLSYTYTVRSTEGEHNVESPWTIRKLSGTLSWLETYSHVADVLVSFGRRVMCFPLYRHFDLVTSAVRDVTSILRAGSACVLRCLLDVHRVFRQNEPAYILNDLYITDYCVWIQRVRHKKLTSFAETVQTSRLRKEDLSLELEELERAAAMVAEEEEEEEEESDDISDSSEEDEESHLSATGGGGEGAAAGGGGGGGTIEDVPRQVQPSSLESLSLQSEERLLARRSLVEELQEKESEERLLSRRSLVEELQEKESEERLLSRRSLVEELQEKESEERLLSRRSLVEELQEKESEERLLSRRSLVEELQEKESEERLLSRRSLVEELQEKESEERLLSRRSLVEELQEKVSTDLTISD